MNTSIVNLGPMGVGKSTLSEGLSNLFEMPRCCVDQVQWEYFPSLGFDQERAKHLNRTDVEAFHEYSAPFLLSAVERALHEHPDHVIDLGAGHAAYNESQQIEIFKELLDPISKVLLLMPSPDLEVCVNLLPGPSSGMKMNPYFIRHPLKDEVAKKVIYTKSKGPANVLEEASQWINERDA